MRAPVDDMLEIPERSSSRRRLVAGGVGAAALIAALATYLLTRGPEESPYRFAPVARTNILKEVLVSGHLEPTDQVEVPAPIAGQLVRVVVQPGDHVEEGQLLAQMDRTDADLALRVARAEAKVGRARVTKAEAALQRATEALERTLRLAARDLASASAVEQAKAEERQARATLEAVRAERSAALRRASIRQRDRDATDVIAPRAGLILEAPDHVGIVVGSEHRLFRIATPLEHMHIEAPIGEADIGDIEVGQSARFEVPAYPGRVFEATVLHISPDPHTEAGAVFYFVTLETRNDGGVLLPGMTAQVRVEISEVQDVLAVREAALRFTPEGAVEAGPRSRIWRMTENGLEPVAVRPGISNGAITEIIQDETNGLEEGDSVAVGMAADGAADLIRPGLSLGGRK